MMNEVVTCPQCGIEIMQQAAVCPRCNAVINGQREEEVQAAKTPTLDDNSGRLNTED